MQQLLARLKDKYLVFKETKTGTFIISEAQSFLVTFTAIFTGSVILIPEVNSLLNTDMPTVTQFKDLLPIIGLAAYRSAWSALLTVTGLYKFRKQSVNKLAGKA